jgi:hypothetical protein
LKRLPDWVPPLAGAILAAVAVHGAWLLSRAAGSVPDCLPHLQGCHSVSESARHGAANVLFKALMIPNALVQAWTWSVAARWVAARASSPQASRGLVPLGIIAAVALAVYATVLGVDGSLYTWLRRYGINFYFLATFCAMLVFVRQLLRLAPASRWTRALLWTCVAMLALGFANVVAPLLGLDESLKDRLRDALEWQLVTLFALWFLMLARVLGGGAPPSA